MDKQAVYEDIKQQIVEEKLSPGHWFIERELCAAYGLSRTPIREILWKLTSDGFLEQEPNRGFVVRKLGLEQIFEVFQAREAIEGMAARLACSKGDDSFRAILREMMEKLNQLDAETDPAQGSSLGRRLHGAIVEAAQNRIMVDIYENLKNLSILTSNITRKSPHIEKISKEAHLMLINALLDQDEEKSERIMREHLRDTCRHIVEQFYPNMLGGTSNSKN
ncbi:MAG: GntR family transcriptional regulator [Deltaproteobacteria bacterium]|nr:GntR family transcriptional regulator [Deltaproteobacteria bacterium]